VIAQAFMQRGHAEATAMTYATGHQALV